MSYAWDHSLETGNAMIDNQHKQLVVALNALLDACRDGKGQEELERTMEFLNGYTIKHFGDEEKLQKQHNYPEFDGHKLLHSDFKRVVGKLTKQLKEEGPSDMLTSELYASVGDWLVHHIKGDDFKLATYLRTQVQA
ncbi:MAG: hemerythrin family protein [Deltaproteobacteria bacterium]|jgi:hemerythrin|nr:hemerythrin family protein [Deltaproteobacteria bacterium]